MSPVNTKCNITYISLLLHVNIRFFTMIEEKVLLGTFGLLLCSYVILKTNRRRRRYKTRPINRQRKTQGSYNYFLKMKAADPEQFFKYTRLLCCQQPTPVLPTQLLTPDWSSFTDSAAVAAEEKNWLYPTAQLRLPNCNRG
jgi:hypothetical protein